MARATRQPVLLAAACTAAFGVLLLVAYATSLGRWADGAALQGFMGLDRPLTTPLFEVVAHVADPIPYGLIGAGLVAVALLRQRPRHALAVAVLLGGSAITTQVLKQVLAHPRAHDFLGGAQIDPAAFPSGHATASMTLALGAVLVVPSAWRPLVAAAGAGFACAVSFSILALAWHYPSDVVGGFLVATAWALAALAGLRAAGARWPERTGRQAARRALDRGSRQAARRALDRQALAGAAAVATGLAVGVAVALLPRIADYAERYTTFTAAAVAILAAAAALLATVIEAAARR